MRRILVTGSGSIGGVNFVRAIRDLDNFYIIGTDYFPYHIKFNDLDEEFISPRHDSAKFIPLIKSLIENGKIEFIHPQPEAEAEVISRYRNQIGAKTYLPPPEVFEVCRDKYKTAEILKPLGFIPKTTLYVDVKDRLMEIFKEMGPLWLRTRIGAGGRLSLLCKDHKDVETWVNLWVRRNKAKLGDFMMQEYLDGQDFAWDSLWYNGELVTSYSRQRLEYPFRHISPSGVTGTPIVSKIIHDERINKVGVKAVKKVDSHPHGFYCLDLKEEEDNKKVYLTEINVKAHTTLALWSYIATKYLKLEEWSNISYLYVKIGLNEEFTDVPKYDIYPEDIILLRHIDVGVKIILPDGTIQKISI